MTNSNTEWGSYRFTVKDHVQEKDGDVKDVSYHIGLETIKEKLEVLGDGFLQLQLRKTLLMKRQNNYLICLIGWLNGFLIPTSQKNEGINET